MWDVDARWYGGVHEDVVLDEVEVLLREILGLVVAGARPLGVCQPGRQPVTVRVFLHLKKIKLVIEYSCKNLEFFMVNYVFRTFLYQDAFLGLAKAYGLWIPGIFFFFFLSKHYLELSRESLSDVGHLETADCAAGNGIIRRVENTEYPVPNLLKLNV